MGMDAPDGGPGEVSERTAAAEAEPPAGTPEAAPGLIGREAEMAALERFMIGPRSWPMAMLLQGPAGIGKTSVWLAAVEQARDRGAQVLVARPSSEEAGWEFAGLADLLDGVSLDSLPVPMRGALEVALLLRAPDPEVDAHAVSAAVLAVLRRLVDVGPIVVAIDDVPWLDKATGSALTFAARRLAAPAVRFLLAARSGEHRRPQLVAALDPEALTLQPLSLGAIGRLVHERLGVRLSRLLIRRVHELTAGNALFALELAREIAAGGGSQGPSDVPLPSRVEELLSDRIAELGAGPREALLAAALSPDPRVTELTATVGEDAIEDAVRAEILVLDGPRVRLAHPLLGEIVKARSRARVRRDLHRRLAAAAGDAERGALHLARAADRPDRELASMLAAAAERAQRRGLLESAAELGEHALALTPLDDAARPQRLLAAAGHDAGVARWGRCGELLRPALERLPTADMRAGAMLLLAEATGTLTAEALDLLQRAVREAPDGSELRARALLGLAVFHGVAQVERLAEAESLAREARSVATAASSTVTAREARATFAWIRAMRGLPGDEAGDAGLEDRVGAMYSLQRSRGVRHLWRGELGPARRALEAAYAHADSRGEGEAYVALRLQLCELELRRGDFDVVAGLLGEWEREQDELINRDAALARCHALLAAGRGDPEAAKRAAAAAIEIAEAEGGAEWHRLEALRAQGLAALLAGEPVTAAASLREVRDRTRAAGVEDPGVFPVAPDLVAALAATDALAEARRVADELASVAEAQDHPWARAASSRARGLIALAQRDDALAAGSLTEAVERLESLDMPFRAARSRHELGVALRRLRRLRDARATLERAAAEFAQLGAPGWERRARGELERIGGRRAAGAQLTATEQRIAQLAALGRANKQIAAELFITVGVVETHLTRVYRKLGVHSRTELAHRLAER